MKRPVSIVASLLAFSSVLSACGASAAGKTEFTEVCLSRMGNSQEKCGCYVSSIEAALTPEQFARLAKAAHDNRQYSGSSWLPQSVHADTEISDALSSATATCLRSV
ncbi:MAG: hypothetical protein SGJ21_00550 [Alphaproteobacteria bacterium]|nr:hypothetical protein [Alphaproteobacteria bacterium]